MTRAPNALATPDETETAGQSLSGLIPLATSQEIRDRGSAFVGYVYRARTADEARELLRQHHLRHAHAQTHTAKGSNPDTKQVYTIAAWRCMAVKPGRTGLGGPDEFEVVDGHEDGGERWAGKKALSVMQREGVIDGVVIVSRWFGGTLLGPIRFTHVETCAGEVCKRFKKVEEMEECVQTLKTLDDLLTTLRARLATTFEEARAKDSDSCPAVPENSRTKSKPADYRTMQDLDLTKAKRLIHARECAIKNTKTLIEKYKKSTEPVL